MTTLKHEVNWSVSRVNELAYCEKKYYFSHYESWNGWDNAESDQKKKAYMLKNRTNIKAWIGDKTHEAIKEYLHRSPAWADNIKDSIATSMKNDFEKSKRKTYLPLYSRRKDFGLIEHYRGEDLSEHDLQEMISSVIDNFNAFLKSMYHDAILDAKKSKRDLYIDPGTDFDKMKFPLDGIWVYAIPDIWFEMQKDKFVILDWKTGKIGDEPADELTLQLMVYGLRLSIDKGVDPARDHIEAYEIYLPAASKVGGIVNSDHLKKAKEHIKSDIRKMQAYLVNIDNNIPKPENDFKATSSEKKCFACNYKEICKEA